ncbi:MAG TPA: triose-phosphate isomerase, partial [Chitinophagales bacterium]|nr:triose-phosphate isomerase [Chitinophagales bacterium]
MRKKIIAGNWKMNTTKDEAIALLNSLTENIQENILSENKIVVVATPFPYLHFAASAFTSKKYFYTAAQNCSEYEQGAYTGEVSAKMLASLEVQYVIIGHSERRQYFNENDEILLQK